MPVVGDGKGSVELSVGLACAQAYSAHLEAIYSRSDPKAAFELAGSGATDRDVLERQISQRADERGGAEAERCGRRFGALCRKAVVPEAHRPDPEPAASAVRRTVKGAPLEMMPAAARRGDLASFTASSARYTPLFENLPGVTLLRSGRPVPCLPEGATVARFRRPFLAWDGLSGAAGAVSAASGLAEEGASATAFHVTEETAGGAPGTADSIVHRASRMARHSVRGGDRAAGLRSVGARLLDVAGSACAGLLVMGGDRHARYRGALLWGVTRAALRHARLPVLMAH